MMRRIWNRFKLLGSGLARLRMIPGYLFGSAEKPAEVIYLIEDANWSIKWDGHHITQGLLKQGCASRVDVSSRFYKHKILHFGSSYTFETQAFKKFSRPNKLVVTFFHGNYGDEVATDRRFDLLIKNIQTINAVILSNSIMRDRLLKMGVPSCKIFLVPIGVCTSTFKPPKKPTRSALKRKLGIPDDAFVIGSFQKDGEGWEKGNEPKLIKGPDVLVKVLERVSKEKKIHVLLSGPSRGYVKAGLKRADIPFSSYYFDHPDQVVPLYQALDAYLITSREEGGPKAIVESLACGVPIVTTDVGMARDVLAGFDCGLICKIGDTKDLAEKLLILSKSPALCKKISQNGLKRVVAFSWDKISLQYKDVYDTIGR